MGLHLKECPCKKDSRTRTQLFLPQLKKLLRCGKNQRVKKLKCISSCLANYIFEAVAALLRTDIKIPSTHYKKLKKHRDLLLFLAGKKHPMKEKRKRLLKQKGGILHILVPALVSGLVGLATKSFG